MRKIIFLVILVFCNIFMVSCSNDGGNKINGNSVIETQSGSGENNLETQKSFLSENWDTMSMFGDLVYTKIKA